MKKKTTIIEAIIAAIFIAASASAITQKESPEFYTTEYYEVQFTFFNYPIFSWTRDENDQPTLVVENKSLLSFTEIIRSQLKGGVETLSLAYLDNGELKWKPFKTTQAFIMFDDVKGSKTGYFYFEYELDRGEGIPPAKCIVAGDLRTFSWDDQRNKYRAGSGGGYVAGGNTPQDFEAWKLAYPAIHVSPAQILPVSGKCRIIPHGYLTGKQMQTILKQGARKLR